MDRISGLPDEVIGHILSFLPTTKSFAQTSVLSKQWRFLWTRDLVLGFTVDDDSKPINQDEFNSWIDTYIFARNARHTVIRLNYRLTLPRCLFTNNTLVDLCIIDSGDIRMVDTVCFPALKKLQLVNVGYDSDDSLAHLISGCPVLEELIIDRMMLNYYDPSLLRNKRLMYARKVRCMLLDKPALRYLRLRASEIPYIWSWELHSLHSLFEADIDLSEGQFSSSCELGGFLHNLRDVKRLTLLLSRLMESTPNYNWLCFEPLSFRNLTELNLRADLSFIKIFLACAENLRVLTIHLTVDHTTQCWPEPDIYTSACQFYTSPCLMNHLETLNLFDFEWSTKQEFEMVKYVLRNAKVLKNMEIMYTAPHLEESDWNDKVEALNRLALCKMQSATCIRLRLSC